MCKGNQSMASDFSNLLLSHFVHPLVELLMILNHLDNIYTNVPHLEIFAKVEY